MSEPPGGSTRLYKVGFTSQLLAGLVVCLACTSLPLEVVRSLSFVYGHYDHTGVAAYHAFRAVLISLAVVYGSRAVLGLATVQVSESMVTCLGLLGRRTVLLDANATLQQKNLALSVVRGKKRIVLSIGPRNHREHLRKLVTAALERARGGAVQLGR